MAWTAEDRRRYAPAIQEMVRAGMLVRLARTMEVIDPQPTVGRQRVWSTLLMLQALWHLRVVCGWVHRDTLSEIACDLRILSSSQELRAALERRIVGVEEPVCGRCRAR